MICIYLWGQYPIYCLSPVRPNKKGSMFLVTGSAQKWCSDAAFFLSFLPWECRIRWFTVQNKVCQITTTVYVCTIFIIWYHLKNITMTDKHYYNGRLFFSLKKSWPQLRRRIFDLAYKLRSCLFISRWSFRVFHTPGFDKNTPRYFTESTHV